MQSRGARMGLLAALAAVAVVLFIVLSGDDDGDDNGGDTTGTTGTTTAQPAFDVITIAGGAPAGGVEELTYSEGDRIRIKVIPEPGIEEVHLHGYDVEKESDGKKPVVFDLPAEITGGFELEAHTQDGDFELATIKVEP